MPQADAYHSEPLLTGFGGYVFGKDADGSYDPTDVGLDTPGGLASAEEIDAMVKSGLLRAGVDYTACLTSMTMGKSLFWITGPWALPDMTASGVDFGIAPLPTMTGTPRTFVDAQGFMVSHFAPNKEAALTYLLNYVATYDVMLSLWEADPRVPTWNELADSMADANTAAFIASVDLGDPTPAIPEMKGAWTAWTGRAELDLPSAAGTRRCLPAGGGRHPRPMTELSDTPRWVRDAVFYQIFPDRFA